MELTQAYSHPSRATLDPGGLRMDVAAELSRPGVRLDAKIRDSLEYARVMLALYEVVSGDFRARPKDHTAYQEWVQQRYLEELDIEMGERLRLLPGLKDKRKSLKDRTTEILKETRPLEQKLLSAEFYTQRRKYYDWLYKFDKDAWWVLDPVVSVHPDCVVFEVFSIDESSYGRVTVPMDKLETFGETQFGTTNVDYSRALADEIRRVRSYRPAFLAVSAGGVSVATGAGERLEKKIDLPPTWVRGFLQCQSAATYPGIDLTLSPSTVADVLSVLKRRREKEGPRSLRFVLAPGQKPKIVIEPWGVEVQEATHVFTGDFTGDVRIWGRRRLFALADLMPYADKVQARLLGTGMPSYWTVYQSTHRFDLGLSGWTKNDWSSAARFDLLAATAEASEGDIAQAAALLERDLRLTPEDLAGRSDLSREVAASALQRLCREGRAMFDIATGAYRWRQLLPVPAQFDDESDQRMNLARRLVATGGVRFLKPDEEDENFPETTMGAGGDDKVTRFRAVVRGGESKRERKFHVVLDLDADGRARFVTCDCAWHRREKLRKGPCAHILAATVLTAQQSTGNAAAPAPAGAKRAAGVPRPDRFAGMTLVFTGALTKFTREQAEILVGQGGGKSSGSVSRTTSYLVAGDKAGSKLTKAQQLGVPVITEDQFLAMLDE
jgi:hypothetical protein